MKPTPCAILTLAAFLLFAGTGATHATFSGSNGDSITSDRDGNEEIYVMARTATTSSGSRRTRRDRFRLVRRRGRSPSRASMATRRFTMNRRHRHHAADRQQRSRRAWSPDGSKIAFETNRDGNSEIYVMDSTARTR